MLAIILANKPRLFARGSLREQIIFTYTLIFALCLAFILIYTTTNIQSQLISKNNDESLKNANFLSILATDSVRSGTYSSLANDLSSFSNLRGNPHVMVLNRECRIVYDSSKTAPLTGKVLLEPIILSALKNQERSYTDDKDEQRWQTFAAVPIRYGDQIHGVVYLSVFDTDSGRLISDTRNSILFVGLFVCALLIILTTIFANWLTRPLVLLTKTLKDYRSGQIETTPLKGSAEVLALSQGFNEMVERLNDTELRRSTFVSNASHELKTPLTSMKLFADSILQMQEIDEEIVREFMSDITNEIDRLTKIIDDLFELTKMDSTLSPSDAKPLDLNELLRAIIKILAPVADEKKISLNYESPGNLEVVSDYNRLWHTIFNIVDNGIKYADEKGLVLVQLQEQEDGALVVVSDNGVGIPQDELNKIFDRFHRVDKARSRDTGGTGLGLSIAKNSIEMCGGRIEVESEEGVGSVFKIYIPNTKKEEAL